MTWVIERWDQTLRWLSWWDWWLLMMILRVEKGLNELEKCILNCEDLLMRLMNRFREWCGSWWWIGWDMQLVMKWRVTERIRGGLSSLGMMMWSSQDLLYASVGNSFIEIYLILPKGCFWHTRKVLMLMWHFHTDTVSKCCFWGFQMSFWDLFWDFFSNI